MTLTLKQVDIGRGLDSKNRVTTNQKHPIDSLKPKRKKHKHKIKGNYQTTKRQRKEQRRSTESTGKQGLK